MPNYVNTADFDQNSFEKLINSIELKPDLKKEVEGQVKKLNALNRKFKTLVNKTLKWSIRLMIYSRNAIFKQAKSYFDCEGCSCTCIKSDCYVTADTRRPQYLCKDCANAVNKGK